MSISAIKTCMCFSSIKLGFCYSRSVLKMDLYNDLVEGLSLSYIVYIRVIPHYFQMSYKVWIVLSICPLFSLMYEFM